MLTAYRAYKVFLNVNSVKESPTMFSRRVFELLACGTPVVSAGCRGIDEMFGQLVRSVSTEAETRSEVSALLDDEDYRSRLAHAGYRFVMENHTYRHRIDTVLDAVGIRRKGTAASRRKPLVSILAPTNRPDCLDNLISNIRRQIYAPIEVVILLNSERFDPKAVQKRIDTELAHLDVRVLFLPNVQTLAECLNEGLDTVRGEFVAKMDDDDYYGANYLSDLALATLYTDAEVIGKRSYYCYLEGSDQLVLRFPEQGYRHVDFVSGATLFVRRKVFDRVRFKAVQRGTDTLFLRQCQAEGFRIYSADPYNFILHRHADPTAHTWQVHDKEFVEKCQIISTGLDMGTVMI